jgi:hypothetical protein
MADQQSERRPRVLHASKLGQFTATDSNARGCEVGFDQNPCRARDRLESNAVMMGDLADLLRDGTYVPTVRHTALREPYKL